MAAWSLTLARAQEMHTVELELRRFGDRQEGAYVVTMKYLAGSLALDPNTLIAKFTASYENFEDGNPGHIDLGQGDTKIAVPELRGMGIGSLMMSLLIEIVQSKLPPLEVETIYLSGEDAKTDEERNRRNGFWKKLGYTFTYFDPEERSGQSKKMMSDHLIPAAQRLRSGWTIEEID